MYFRIRNFFNWKKLSSESRDNNFLYKHRNRIRWKYQEVHLTPEQVTIFYEYCDLPRLLHIHCRSWSLSDITVLLNLIRAKYGSVRTSDQIKIAISERSDITPEFITGYSEVISCKALDLDLIQYLNKVDWTAVSRRMDLTCIFIVKNYDKVLDRYIQCSRSLDVVKDLIHFCEDIKSVEILIQTYGFDYYCDVDITIDISKLSSAPGLCESFRFVERNKDKLDWTVISNRSDLSDRFKRYFSHYIIRWE